MDSDGDDKPPAPPVRLASHKETMPMLPPQKPLPSVPEHERKKKKFKDFLIGEDKC